MSDRAFDLRYQTDARVLVGDEALMPADGGTPPGFIADTDLFSDTRRPVYVAVRAMNHGETVVDIVGDSLAVGVPLYDGNGVSGVVIAERRLTEVTTARRPGPQRVPRRRRRRPARRRAARHRPLEHAAAPARAGCATPRCGSPRPARTRPPMPHDERRDEVGDLARALARMQEELRRQETARRAFVSTASHELRTPLTMLQGTMELLEEDLADSGVDIADAQLQVATRPARAAPAVGAGG